MAMNKNLAVVVNGIVTETRCFSKDAGDVPTGYDLFGNEWSGDGSCHDARAYLLQCRNFDDQEPDPRYGAYPCFHC